MMKFNEEQYSFVALMQRLRLLNRWSLMRNMFTENVAEHSHLVAVIAHLLATIRIDIFKKERPSPDRVAMAALLHDSCEVLIGDWPSPTKTFDEEINAQCKKLEKLAVDRLMATLPEALRASYQPLLYEEDEMVKTIVKAADLLDAYIKAVQETQAGNREFIIARDQIRDKINRIDLQDEISYFNTHFMQGFELTIDEL